MMKIAELNRSVVVRGIFIVYLICFIFKFHQAGFAFQFAKPLMMYPSINVTYWLFLLLKIPQFIVSNLWAAIASDLILVGSCIALIVYPKKYFLAILFTIFNWLNYMEFCLVNVYQPSVIGPLIMSFPALFKSDFKFSLTFWAIRYWACFLYFEAGILKFIKGSIFHHQHMVNSVKTSMPLYFVQTQENTLRLSFKYFLIDNPGFAHLVFIAAAVLELCFLIGFFTRKFDWLLLGLFLVFHVANEFVMNMTFLNHQVLLICCFMPWEKLSTMKFGSTQIFGFQSAVKIKGN